MSFEKPPITPTPEQEARKTPTPEEVKSQEKAAEQARASENTASVLSSENKSFFGRMSEEGRRITNQVYEGLHRTPGVSKIVGRMEVAYNQFLIDRHQEKAIKLGDKINGLGLHIDAFDQSKKEIESVIESLRRQNMPGVESLQIKLQDIDRQKAVLLRERDGAQSKLEARDNKTKLYTNERDRVADKLIEHYEERLRPMEAELERLQTFRDQTDLLVAVTEARHKESLARLGDIEKKKNQIEDALRRGGMSEKAIRKFEAIKQLDKVLADGRKKVRTERENLAWRKAEINERIAQIDAKANPYRDKREEFVRVKERRPIKVDVATRQKGEVFTGEEEVRTRRRAEASHERKSTMSRFEAESDIEEKAEGEKRLQTAALLAGWNAFIKETYKDAGRFVDLKDFLRATRLSEDYELDLDSFKNILGKYLKFKRMPMEQFNQSINAFFEKTAEAEK